MSTKNARIESTFLGREDHGIFTFNIMLDYGSSGQGFGNYGLDEPIFEKDKFKERKGTAWGMQLIITLLNTLGLDKWEDLPETYVRVRIGEDQRIEAIGHLLQDKWFDPKELT